MTRPGIEPQRTLERCFRKIDIISQSWTIGEILFLFRFFFLACLFFHWKRKKKTYKQYTEFWIVFTHAVKIWDHFLTFQLLGRVLEMQWEGEMSIVSALPTVRVDLLCSSSLPFVSFRRCRFFVSLSSEWNSYTRFTTSTFYCLVGYYS